MWKRTTLEASGLSTTSPVGEDAFWRERALRERERSETRLCANPMAAAGVLERAILFTVGYACGVLGKLENERNVT